MLEKNDLEKVLELVAKGDPALLLAESNLVETMNDLCKKGLVDIKEGKFYLTQAGQDVLQKRGENIMKKMKVEKDLAEFSETNLKTGNIKFLISLILCLLSILLLLIIHQVV